MAALKFFPCARVRLKLGIGANTSSVLKVGVQFRDENVVLETGQNLKFLEGELQIYKDSDSTSSQWLKSNGFVGIFDYAKNDDCDLYSIQLHLPEVEFFQIVQLVYQETPIEFVEINTPVHDQRLTYTHQDTITWKNKEPTWVPIETSNLSFGAIDSDKNDKKSL